MNREMSSMMEYKGYHATIEYDNDDELFIGNVFGIVDSLNFHGTSTEELREMFHQCIDNYLDFCKSVNKNPEKEFKGTFNVRIPTKLHRTIAFNAAEQHITLNQYITDILTQAINPKPIELKIMSVGVAQNLGSWQMNDETKNSYNVEPYLCKKEVSNFGKSNYAS